jgi:hypothetical protein
MPRRCGALPGRLAFLSERIVVVAWFFTSLYACQWSKGCLIIFTTPAWKAFLEKPIVDLRFLHFA